MPIRKRLSELLCAAAITLVGCSGPRVSVDESVSEAQSALGSTTAGCFNWSTVDRTLTGGGEFVSPETYNPPSCFKAYLLNLVDYNKTKYNGGGAIGYGGAIPTTQAACTSSMIRAIAWRREGTTMILERDARARGRWYTGFDGVGRCLPATLHLERDLGLRPNGTRDYRIAMTARPDGGSDAPTVPVGFITVENHVRPPLAQVQDLRKYLDALNASGATLEPWLQSTWNIRNTRMGQMACRKLQIDRGLHAFTRAAMIKAGATAATVDARNTALGNISTALCTAGGTTTALNAAYKDYITRVLAMFDQISGAVLAEVPASYHETRDVLAANMLAQIPDQALSNLTSKCDLEVSPLMSYVLHGMLPAGVTDPLRVVLGGCSGQSPSAAAAGIGFGATPAGGAANGVRAMAQCMAGLTSGVTHHRCSSPLAEGAPSNEAAECWDDNADGKCDSVCTSTATKFECTTPQKNSVAEKKGESTTEGGKVESTTGPEIEGNPPTPRSKLERIGQRIKDEPGTAVGLGFGGVAIAATGVKVNADLKGAAALPPDAPGRDLKVTAANAGAVGHLAATVVYTLQVLDFIDLAVETEEENAEDMEAIRNWCATNPTDPLEVCDRNIGPQAYCPADPALPAGGWFEIGAGGPRARQANIKDMFDHCLCTMVDADYAAIGRREAPSRAPAPTCPKTEEQRKLECAADPRMAEGPDGAPDPECYELLAPVYDYDAWRTKDCARKLCPSGRQGYAMPNGECVCDAPNPAVGRPDCRTTPRASNGLCTDDNSGACFCSATAPSFPNGADPFCRFNIDRLPGPLSAWMPPDTDALHAEVFNATTDVLRVRAGGNTQFVGPTLFPNTFPVRGNKFRQKAAIFKKPALGENVDLKAYYTNRSRNIFRRFFGQCRMNDFTVGALTNCDYDLPVVNGVNVATFEEPFEIEWELDTAVTYATRPALGAISFQGVTFATPADRLPPSCPDPGPGGPELVDVPSPWNDWLNGRLINPTYPSPGGFTFEVPLTIPVSR